LIERRTVFIVMTSFLDGDTPNLEELVAVSQTHCYLVVDEAHALGVLENMEGLVQMLNLQDSIFARIMTLARLGLSWCCYFRLRRA
jgi:7-keto-8-aminopelargonate synthetase-like enzyme